MSKPLTVDLPHQLGAAEARRRIERNIGRLADHIPGGAQVNSAWVGDRVDLSISAMGQDMKATIDIEEALVRLQVILPAALSFFAAPIEALIRRQGTQMLEDKSGRA
ncbi:MAG TPA: polyhydroxyalkanoic acid system family protein [Allosphingosinicella sp.]|nr:polyhydroxyalkanoic acid system family protein [Allosphingosinicella sp.]